MAGWSFVGIDTYAPGTEGTSAQLLCPAGVQDHNLMVAVVVCETETFGVIDVQGPGGWIKAGQDFFTVGGNGPVMAVFYRIATSGDVAGVTTYDFTWAHTSTARVAALVAQRGVHRDTPLVQSPQFGRDSNGGTNLSTGNLSTSSATNLGIAAWLAMHSAARTWTPPGSWTERGDVSSDGTGTDDTFSLAVADFVNLLSGSANAIASASWTTGLGMGLVFARNPTPQAPLVTGRSNFDATTVGRFEWDFSDLMPSDEQTAFQLRIFRVSDGVLVHDTGKTTSADEFYDLTASTLANGNQYQWQVKTWDVDDNEGPYSSLQSFHCSAPPTTDVTSPTEAQVLTSPEHTTTFTYTDPEGEAKSAHQIILKVAGQITFDSGKVPGTALSLDLMLDDDTSYVEEAFVWDAKDIKSAVATRNFSVDYEPPPTPTIAVTDQGHFLRATITNPAPQGAQPIADHNDIYRRSVGGSFERIATDVSINGIYDDYATASGVTYEYKARAVGGGTFADSESASESVTLKGVWIHDPSSPTATVHNFRFDGRGRGVTRSHEKTNFRFAGRTFPVTDTETGRSYLCGCVCRR